MRSVLLIFFLCVTVVGAFATYSGLKRPRLVSSSGVSPINSLPMSQSEDSVYALAYDRWTRAIDSNPGLGEPFWVRSDIGPAEMRVAVSDLLSFGPNLLPFLVDELRRETDSIRVYRLLLLLNAVAGINLYYDSDVQNVFNGSSQLRDSFVKDWDSGKFLNATQLLRDAWTKGHRVTASERIDPRNLTQVRRYGVFAIPFINENIESTNSPELFAAFLIITGKSDLYDEYLESPMRHFASREQKRSLIKSWVSENEKKMDKVKGLHDQIRSLAATQP
jgi:hypothetical protein